MFSLLSARHYCRYILKEFRKCEREYLLNSLRILANINPGLTLKIIESILIASKTGTYV